MLTFGRYKFNSGAMIKRPHQPLDKDEVLSRFGLHAGFFHPSSTVDACNLFRSVRVPNSLDLSWLRLLMFALVRQIHVCATKNPVLQ